MTSNKQVLKEWNALNEYVSNFKGTWEELKESLDVSTSDANNIDLYYGCFEGTIHNNNGKFKLSYFIDVMNEDIYDDWDKDVDIRLLGGNNDKEI